MTLFGPVPIFTVPPRALRAGIHLRRRIAPKEANVIGEGEGLELLAVFITFMLGLGIMVALGKWWEA